MWLMRFMQGRYGFDELGRALGTGVIVLFIVCLLLNVPARFGLIALYYVSHALNLAAWALIIYQGFRMLSRNIPARRAENERYLEWRANHMGKRGERSRRRNSAKGSAGDLDKRNYLYLNCPACGQDMRIPRGKGKVAVRCPQCGQNTITIS